MPMRTPELQAEYQKLWIAKRRAEYFADKCCAICGSSDRLELDHIVPEDKEIQPASLWSMALSNPRRIAELTKCQILCYDHHKEKTRTDWVDRRTHGRGLYKHGCRCDICFKAQQLHNAQRKK